MGKIKVAAYCRVSTDYDDQINSLKSQISYFTEYINKNPDWVLINVFADEGLSGTSTKKRKEFISMIEAARRKEIDLIITKEVSRFARNTVDTLTYTRELKALGIGVFFINDNINTLDNDGELRLTIMSSIAQEESRKTSERVKWGQKRKMEQGVVFGNGLYGYNLKNGKLIINDDEAKIVRLIFSKYVYEKKGGNTIARELNIAGIKPKYSNEWSSNAIIKIIKNEKYCGDLLQKKTCTTDFLNHKKTENNDIEPKILIKNHHEAIISRELWEQAQEELKKRTRSKSENSRHSIKYWCSGKIFCGKCGSRFVSKTSKSKSGYIYKGWRCYNATKYGSVKINSNGEKIGCDNKCVNDKILKECVQFLISKYLSDIDIINEIKSDIKLLTDNNYEARKLSIIKEIEKTNVKSEKALESFLEGIISKQEYISIKDKYSKKLKNLQTELNNQESLLTSNYSNYEKIIYNVIQIHNNMKKNIPNEFVLKELLENIQIFKNNIFNIKLTFNDFFHTLQFNKDSVVISKICKHKGL